MRFSQAPLESKPTIVVIGAGLAGLTAAYRLQQKGHEVHVYEARHRPGGRVLSVKLGDNYEELGGQNFFHGAEAKNSLNLIQEFNLKTLHYEKPFSCLYAENKCVTSLSELFKKFKEPVNLWETMGKAAIPAPNLQTIIDNIFKDDPELCHVFTLCLTTYEGSEPKKLDPSCIDSFYDLFSLFKEGILENTSKPNGMKRLTLKGGNAQLPMALADRLHNKIHYGAVLTRVERNQEKVILTFNKGQEIIADVVLMTPPCSVFQDIRFGPEAIPQEQLEQMLNVQYGTNAKILVPVTFQDEKWEFLLHIPHFVSWLNEDDRIISFFSGGEHGVFNQDGAETMLHQGIALFNICYEDGKIKGKYLEETQDKQLVSYEDAVFKSWAKDPYTKGSYSNRGVGQAALLDETIRIHGEEIRNIFRPIHNQIFFAGEHTTILPVLGTMEAAIESGERMARLMEKCLKEA